VAALCFATAAGWLLYKREYIPMLFRAETRDEFLLLSLIVSPAVVFAAMGAWRMLVSPRHPKKPSP
jgi:hypothetical protein